MHVFIATDHAGFELKNSIVEYLRTRGIEVTDLGAHTLDPEDDYPDFVTPCARAVAEECAKGGVARGIILGGSGQGEAMCANRVPGARAALYYSPAYVGPRRSNICRWWGRKVNDQMVALTREHNDANILSLGARFLSQSEALEAVRTFLATPASSDSRHARRLAKF